MAKMKMKNKKTTLVGYAALIGVVVTAVAKHYDIIIPQEMILLVLGGGLVSAQDGSH